MEKIKNVLAGIVTQEGQKPNQLQKRLQESTDGINKESDGIYSIEPFGSKITANGYAKATVKAALAFPKLPPEFFEVLNDRALSLGFSDKKLEACINNVIDNCIYPEPTLANFISFESSIKLYSYNQKLKFIDELGPDVANKLYKSVRVEGMNRPLWAHIDIIEKYNLELWNK